MARPSRNGRRGPLGIAIEKAGLGSIANRDIDSECWKEHESVCGFARHILRGDKASVSGDSTPHPPTKRYAHRHRRPTTGLPAANNRLVVTQQAACCHPTSSLLAPNKRLVGAQQAACRRPTTGLPGSFSNFTLPPLLLSGVSGAFSTWGRQIAVRLSVFLACRSGRNGCRGPLWIAIDTATRYRKSRTGSIAIANRDIDSDPERTTTHVAVFRAGLLSGHFLFVVYVFRGTNPDGRARLPPSRWKIVRTLFGSAGASPSRKDRVSDSVAAYRAKSFVDQSFQGGGKPDTGDRQGKPQ